MLPFKGSEIWNVHIFGLSTVHTLESNLSLMRSPYFLLATDRTSWSFVSIVVAFAFTLVAAAAAQITLGNVVRVYPGTVQGLTFYLGEYIYN